MTLNEMFAICYVIDSQLNEEIGELGGLFANTVISKSHKPNYYGLLLFLIGDSLFYFLQMKIYFVPIDRS